MADLTAADNHATTLVEQIESKEEERNSLAAENAERQELWLAKVATITEKSVALDAWNAEIRSRQLSNDLLRKRIANDQARAKRVADERAQVHSLLEQRVEESNDSINCLSRTAFALSRVLGEKIDLYSLSSVAHRTEECANLLHAVIAQQEVRLPFEALSPQEFCDLKDTHSQALNEFEASQDERVQLCREAECMRSEASRCREESASMADHYYSLCSRAGTFQQRLNGLQCAQCSTHVYATDRCHLSNSADS